MTYEYCEDCKKETIHVPIASFDHGLTSEDIELDGWVCERCYLNKCNEN